MAAQFGSSWNNDLWRQVANLIANGPPPQLPTSPSPATTRQRQRQVRLTKAQVNSLIADYQAGMSIAETARTYGIALTTATKHLKDNNITIRPNKVAIPKTEHPALLKLKAEGLTNVQIAQHYGCTRQAVQMALQRASRSSETD